MSFAGLLPAACPIAQPFAPCATVCMNIMALKPPQRAIIYNFGVSHNIVNVFVMSHHDHRPMKYVCVLSLTYPVSSAVWSVRSSIVNVIFIFLPLVQVYTFFISFGFYALDKMR